MTRALMFQGTGSDVGKSVLVAGFCRLLTNRGLRVQPFKPQNMSNNAAVTPDGGEIGRAQALQARACRVPLSVDMNPVLLKPQTDVGAQVVVRGKVIAKAGAKDYQTLKRGLLSVVLSSFEKLKAESDMVVVEGAGSPAEVNLRAGDIANMGFACAANVPVVLIGDIDRGGVIASVVGTHALLSAAERKLIRGFVINKFRGDINLFDGGRAAITQFTGFRDYGVLPWLSAVGRLPAEDAVVLGTMSEASSGVSRIAVPMLSRIANFDDFDPLHAEPEVELLMVPPGNPLPICDLVIIPGTKATIADLRFFREQGWHTDLFAHARRGGRVLGICGGYQMLGQTVVDPHGVEGVAEAVNGLGLLDVQTTLAENKRLASIVGRHVSTGVSVSGYEMHIGETTGSATEYPFLAIEEGREERGEGAVTDGGRTAGTYVHGLFSNDVFRAEFLKSFGVRSNLSNFDAGVESALDELALEIERHLDVDGLMDAASR